MKKSKEAISSANLELGDMPETTNIIIKFLNSRNSYELEELGVVYMTKTILLVKKVLTKKDLNVKL